MTLLHAYLYSVSFVGLGVFYGTAIFLSWAILQLVLGIDHSSSIKYMISQTFGFMIVGLPVWIWHWDRLLKELASQKENAPRSLISWHNFYAFTLCCFAIMAVLAAGGTAASKIVAVAVGAGSSVTKLWRDFGTGVFATTLSLLLWYFHWKVIRKPKST